MSAAPTGFLELGLTRLREVSLTRHPAAVRRVPVHWYRLGIGDGQPWGLPLFWQGYWRRAAEALKTKRYRQAVNHLEIVDLDELSPLAPAISDIDAYRRRVDEEIAQARRAALKPKPKPTRTREAARSDAAHYAAEHRLAGYGWTDKHSVQHRVRSGGSVTGFG